MNEITVERVVLRTTTNFQLSFKLCFGFLKLKLKISTASRL